MMYERQQISDAFEMLGSPDQREMLLSIEDPFMQRASWNCGCVIDFVDEHFGAFHWDVCAAHNRPRVGPTSQGGFAFGSDF